jgi:hypothetical protein
MNMMTRWNTKACKRCKVVTSVLTVGDRGNELVSTLRGALWMRALVDRIGRVFHTDNGTLRIPCRGGCGVTMFGHRVAGRLSETHRCGSKCLTSKGFVCDCSCGGANHGAGFEAVQP